MNLEAMLSGFALELVKLGFQAMPKREPAAAKVDRHFSSASPDWNAFEKGLRSKPFRELAKKHELADPKLKTYIKNFGGYLASKDELARIKSKDSGATYVIKDLHNGRLGCNCGNWQYRKSVRGGDCKHIKSLKASKMIRKEAGWNTLLTAPIATGGAIYGASVLAKKNLAKGKAVSQAEKSISADDATRRQNRLQGMGR
jgi:hypothetical protein